MKRGTILLLNNIAIRFNKKDFEYDVYSLVKAFYPHAQVTMFYEEEEEPEERMGCFSWLSMAVRRFVWLSKKTARRFSDSR